MYTGWFLSIIIANFIYFQIFQENKKLDAEQIPRPPPIICVMSFCCSSAENIAVFIWESLAELLPLGSLHEIKLHETDKNVVYFKGEYA